MDGQIGSFFHTSCNANEWWRVDLQKSVSISSVRIFNLPGWGSRLDGAEVRVGDTDSFAANMRCATVTVRFDGSEPWFDLECLAVGRYLFVVDPQGDCLHFEEISIQAAGLWRAETVTISGLTGSTTATSASLAVTTCADRLGTGGNWNIDGTLVLTASGTLGAN